MSFKSSSERLTELNEMRDRIGDPISYGNPFLDDALGGIYLDDLILLTAKTGGGKTELATQIATNAAKQGKIVHFFSLEAHVNEIESRIKFKHLTQAFFTQIHFRDSKMFPDYQDWFQGKQDEILKKFEPEVDEIFKRETSTLQTFYTSRDFNGDTFESHMDRIGEFTDLIIVDHLHYFEFDSDNENASLKKTIKQIKNVISQYRKPVVLLAQLRKSDRYSGQLMPETDDIHGSSDVSKIVTKIIATAPAREQLQTSKHIFPTYIRVLKNRTSGARTFYTALCGFDSFKNSYTKSYQLGTLKNNNSEFCLIEPQEYPQWAKSLRSV